MTPSPSNDFDDFTRAPNQADDPALYDVENAAIDPDGVLLAAMRGQAPWAGRTMLDLGCGSGWWLSGYAEEVGTGGRVIGVEPDPTLLPLARSRPGGATVLTGSAEHVPLPDASIDVAHARFAYFFPPGCDAGLTEVLRVLRPGGALVVVDNDHRHGQFAELLAASAWAAYQGTADVTDAWWRERGAERLEVMSSWSFRHRADLAAVLHLEFPADVADSWLRAHPDATSLGYGYVLFTVRR